MTDNHNCPACGAELPTDSPSGLCVPCALGKALQPDSTFPPDNASQATVHLSLPTEQLGERLTVEQAVGPQGRFQLHTKLGEGGMGEVWLASDQELSHDGMAHYVALKFLSQSIQSHPKALIALRSEVLNSQKLSHPNIVRIFDLHSNPGGPPFIKLEFVDGHSLSKWLREQPDQAMPWRMAAQMALQVSAALRYAHESVRIVHRDLKPANILMTESGVYKLADFGIAMHWKPDVLHGSEDTIMGLGTLAYASPQQLAGQRAAPEDDIYALGVTLYEALTGSPPFEANSAAALIHKVHHEPPQPIPQRLIERGCNNEVPVRLAALVQRCLEKDPLLRPKARDIPFLLPAAEEFGKPPRLLGEQSPELWQDEPVTRSYHWLWTILFVLFISSVLAVWQNWGGLGEKAMPETLRRSRTTNSVIPSPQNKTTNFVETTIPNFAEPVVPMTNPPQTTIQTTVKATTSPQEIRPKTLPVQVQRLVKPVATAPRRAEQWVNSLGMVFRYSDNVEVSKLESGVWVSETEVTVDSFSKFVAATRRDMGTKMISITADGWRQLGYSWDNPGPGFSQTVNHPVIGVNWDDANDFCNWLTNLERNSGRITMDQEYSLPTKNQWYQIATAKLDRYVKQERMAAANYSGVEVMNSPWPSNWPVLDINDGFPRTAPPDAKFQNGFGLYHLAGNAAEWCKEKVLCGCSWADGESLIGTNSYSFEQDLALTATRSMPPGERHDRNGFRVILMGQTTR